MRIALIGALALVASAVSAGPHLREYGSATTIHFKLYQASGALDTDEADSGTEVTLYCDGGVGAPATNNFVNEEGPDYSIALTAVEMQCPRLTIGIAATDLEVVHVETYGNPLAQHPYFPANAQAEAAVALAAYNAVATTDLPANFGELAITATTGQVTVGTNTDKTGYQLTQGFPANFADMSITPTTGRVDVGFVGGTAQTANDNGADVNAIRAVTDQLTFTVPGQLDANVESWNAEAIATALITLAQVRGEVDSALVALYLDRLFAVDYDPALPPGAPTAYLNELAESDGGVTRLTANALEQAPASGGGSDWTTGEREEIRGRLGVTGTTAAGGNTPTLALQATADAILDDTGNTGVQVATDAIGSAQIAVGAIGASEIAAGAIGGSELAADAVAEIQQGLATTSDVTALNDPTANEIALAVRDVVIDPAGAVTLGCSLAATLARLAGDWSGTTTVVYTDPTGTQARVTVDLTGDNQRDATITCPTY